jgi:hypothetical protein
MEMYCVENQVCVVLGARTHGFQDSKEPETELITQCLTVKQIWSIGKF